MQDQRGRQTARDANTAPRHSPGLPRSPWGPSSCVRLYAVQSHVCHHDQRTTRPITQRAPCHPDSHAQLLPRTPTSAPTPSPGHPPTCPAFLNVILKTLYTQKHSVYTVGCGFSHPGESTRAPSTWHPPVAGSFLLPSCAHDAEEPLCPAVHLLRDARPSRFRLLGIELPCSLTYGVLCDRNCSFVWEKARSIAAALGGNCIFNLTRNCQAPSPGRRHMNVPTGVGCEMRFLPSSVS